MPNQFSWFDDQALAGPVLGISSPVIGEEPAATPSQVRAPEAAPAPVPPVVYLPCDPDPDGDGRVVVQTRQMQDGRSALLAYTALDRLHSCCGLDQHWGLFSTAALEKLDQVCPFDVIMLDLHIPEEARSVTTGAAR